MRYKRMAIFIFSLGSHKSSYFTSSRNLANYIVQGAEIGLAVFSSRPWHKFSKLTTKLNEKLILT